MKAIDHNKIIGVKIWKNEEEYNVITYGILNNNNSWRVIEFKSLEEVDELIKDLKHFKKTYIEMKNKGHL